MLGLSASMWGEQVDSHNIYSRMWPRAIGAAERMWSPAEYTDESDIFTRVEKQRCSMVVRCVMLLLRGDWRDGWCGVRHCAGVAAFHPLSLLPSSACAASRHPMRAHPPRR